MHLIKAPHAKNPDLENLHQAATKRLEELKLQKQTLFDLKKTKRVLKKRDKVEVIMQETEQNNAELVAE
jgi:hypothetical protein